MFQPTFNAGVLLAPKSFIKRATASWRASVMEPITFTRRLKRCDPVVIFQMGKVASTSIYYSLKDVYPGVVVHTHWMKQNHHDWQVRRFYNEVFAAKRPLQVISLTREPIGRNLSAFFQNYEQFTGTARGEVSFSVDELTELFLKKYHHDFPLNWFEENIERLFCINVYAEEFPQQGYHYYENENVKLLVLRSEIEDELKERAVRAFLDISTFQIRSHNISAHKEYGDEYTHFKKYVKLPQQYIDRMCASRYVHHFYAADIEAIREKWMSRLENRV